MCSAHLCVQSLSVRVLSFCEQSLRSQSWKISSINDSPQYSEKQSWSYYSETGGRGIVFIYVQLFSRSIVRPFVGAFNTQCPKPTLILPYRTPGIHGLIGNLNLTGNCCNGALMWCMTERRRSSINSTNSCHKQWRRISVAVNGLANKQLLPNSNRMVGQKRSISIECL